MLFGGLAISALVTARAVVQDLYRGVRAAQIMAFVAILQSTAPIIAPVIGGGLDTAFGWRAIFIFLVLYAFAVGLCAAIWFKESRPEEDGQPAGALFSAATAACSPLGAILPIRRFSHSAPPVISAFSPPARR